MKQFKRTLIGIATVDYDDSGIPISGSFQPCDHQVDIEEIEKLLLVGSRSVDDVMKNAQSVMSSYFLKLEKVESADRETSKIETKQIYCETWKDGTPKVCEIAFYFVETEEKPRNFTGVR